MVTYVSLEITAETTKKHTPYLMMKCCLEITAETTKKQTPYLMIKCCHTLNIENRFLKLIPIAIFYNFEMRDTVVNFPHT